MTFKEQVYKACNALLEDKILLLQKTLGDLRESAANETKSTAGDKHETALAMLQIEQKNVNSQLENYLFQKAILNRIDPSLKPVNVTTGALIKTNKGCLFLSIPLGKICVDSINVIALSPQSPLGSKLIQLLPGQSTTLNGVNYLIESID